MRLPRIRLRLWMALLIPIRREARSLNLANAVAIALFEAVRQIGKMAH